MNYWLIKSEPDCYSIDDLMRDGTALWTGVRNYQARNYMRDQMKVGDLVLFYHSSTKPMGVVGIAKVMSKPVDDLTGLDPKDDHYDPKATKEKPIWSTVSFRFVKKLKKVITLDEIKFEPRLKGIMVAARGSRLSVQPLTKQHYEIIVKM